MAKEGLEFFPLNCRLDEKIELIEAQYGLKGFAVVVKLFQRIYGEHGYYCEWNHDIAFLFARQNGLAAGEAGNNLIAEVAGAAIRRGIFDRQLYETHGILTSRGIQKRYFEAVSRRKEVAVKKEYLLLSAGSLGANVVILDENVCRNPKNAYISGQSKGKESKVNMTVSKDTVCRAQDVRLAVERWNSLADTGIKPVSRMDSSSKRYRSLAARIGQHGIEDVLKAIENVRGSGFLQGKNKNGWTITFDWFVLPGNFPKVLEGNYSGRRAGQEPAAGGTANRFKNFHERGYDYDELERQLTGTAAENEKEAWKKNERTGSV